MPKTRRFCATVEIAGEGRVDSGKVGTAERLAAAFGQIATVDGDGSEVGSRTPRIMLMVVVCRRRWDRAGEDS